MIDFVSIGMDAKINFSFLNQEENYIVSNIDKKIKCIIDELHEIKLENDHLILIN